MNLSTDEVKYNNIISTDEVRYNSIIATHQSLFNLGKAQQEEETRVKTLKNRYEYLKGEISNNLTYNILKLKIDDILKKHLHNEKINNIIELFNIYNEFATMNIELVSNLQTHNLKIEDEYNSLRIENNETNKEFDDKNKYWEERVIKLRAKCIDKNKTIIKLERNELYNVCNIILKNILLIIICIFDVNCIEYIYDNLVYILVLVSYSFYSNICFISNHVNTKQVV
jgi:hypothetical protein